MRMKWTLLVALVAFCASCGDPGGGEPDAALDPLAADAGGFALDEDAQPSAGPDALPDVPDAQRWPAPAADAGDVDPPGEPEPTPPPEETGDGEPDPGEEPTDAPAPRGGDGAPLTGFEAPTEDPCLTLQPTIRGTDGPDRLIGTDGPDIIFGYGGDDEIWGNGGDDIICAGGGEDRVYGGAGNDYIDAGFGRDWVDGGAGHDIIHGRSGGDLLRGGHGNDILFGGLLDDELYGDEGNDILIGGHGIDHLHGGPGDDWLRGDTNRDEFIGGAGTDTVSFMTATPPGQPLGNHARVEGVIVDNRDPANGRASGDGYQESLVGVEVIIGSPFDDNILAAQEDPGNPPERPEGPFVYLATPARDLGLVVLGSLGWVDDHLIISVDRGVARVRSGNGAAVTAGPGCVPGANAAEVLCPLPSELRYLTGYGGPGNDTLILEGNGFPRDLTATLDGGEGDDHLVGHRGEDILFAGPTGNDRLVGGPGDDALISESTDGDFMDAGGGNDQLVANYPCAGHEFIGGGGIDVGGFARVGTHFDTAAERRRQRIEAQIGFRAFQPAFCERNQGTRLANDIEILEGAGGDDELIGNDGDNTIWGWGGDDVIRGLGGNDTLEGHQGNDQLYGGPGRDRLRGGAGFNRLYARDGERDTELSCGNDGRLEQSDPQDPNGAGCR